MEGDEEELIRKLIRKDNINTALSVARSHIIRFRSLSRHLLDQDIDSLFTDRKNFINSALSKIGYTYEEVEHMLLEDLGIPYKKEEKR